MISFKTLRWRSAGEGVRLAMCTDLTQLCQTLGSAFGPAEVIRMVCTDCNRADTCSSVTAGEFDMRGQDRRRHGQPDAPEPLPQGAAAERAG